MVQKVSFLFISKSKRRVEVGFGLVRISGYYGIKYFCNYTDLICDELVY